MTDWRDGIDTKKRHDLKAAAARQLHDQGVLGKDYSDVLELLNEGRKDTAYEGDPLKLGSYTIEDLAQDVEELVEAAENASV